MQRERLILLQLVGQRILHAGVLVGHTPHQVCVRRRQRTSHTALVHDAVVLLLDLHVHALARSRRAVPTQAQLLLVQGLFQTARNQVARRRVEIQASDARAAVLVGGHAPGQRVEHFAMLLRV